MEFKEYCLMFLQDLFTRNGLLKNGEIFKMLGIGYYNFKVFVKKNQKDMRYEVTEKLLNNFGYEIAIKKKGK